jgi:Fe-S-cluster containining protein
MNVPAIAKKTFDELSEIDEYRTILNSFRQELSEISDQVERAKFLHEKVDHYNQEVFSHPLVKQLSPCKMNCSACCHTQVSVNSDEAILLHKRVKDGVSIPMDRLKKQMAALNDHDEFYKIPFEDRKCVFLSEEGSCRIYEDRPSVCRSNSVLGTNAQCDTSRGVQQTHLVKTPKADLVVYESFSASPENGSLPYMLGRLLDP